MMKVKVNGISRTVPENWDDVTFKQFLGLINAKRDSTEVVPIMLGMKPEDVRGAKIQGLELILHKLDFLSKTFAIDETPIKLGEYVFPKDIGFETIEQFEDVHNEIKRVAKTKDIYQQTESMALYAAIYCQGINEEYDSKKAKALAEKFLDYPCKEVVAAGSFFQAKCLSITTNLSMTYLRQNTLLKKKRPGLDRLTRRLVSMLQWITSPAMWGKQTKTF